MNNGPGPAAKQAARPIPNSGARQWTRGANRAQQARRQIEAVLTDSQKQSLPIVMRDMEALRAAGIPTEVLDDLKLSSGQQTQLLAIGRKAQQDMRPKQDNGNGGDPEAGREAAQKAREAARQKAMQALTAEQRATLDAFRKSHPQPRPGEGFGPPPGGPEGEGRPPRDGNGPPPRDGDGPPPPPDGSPEISASWLRMCRSETSCRVPGVFNARNPSLHTQLTIQ